MQITRTEAYGCHVDTTLINAQTIFWKCLGHQNEIYVYKNVIIDP